MGNKKANKGRKSNAATVTKLTKETPGIKIELLAEDEEMDPADSFDDARDVAFARDGLASGNCWAWFVAHIRVTFDGLTADAYLGSCSYEDESHFRADGYFSDKVDEAIDDLNAQIAKRAHFAACAHCAAVSKGDSLPDPIAHA